MKYIFSVILLVSFSIAKPVVGQDSKVGANINLIFNHSMHMLQALHYKPLQWDDSLSDKIFSGYFESLDPDKKLFTQADINSLKTFRYTLDQEIKSGIPLFYKDVNAIYKKRLSEAGAMVKEILATPFDYSLPERYNPKKEEGAFAESEKEQKRRWQKYLKFNTLANLESLLARSDKDSTLSKDTAVLQTQAREAVLKTENRIIETLLKRTTNEEAFSSYLNFIFNLYDPHSSYFLPVDRRGFQESMSGIYYGIGALLQEQHGKVKIAELMIGGPAWKNGTISKNDVIVKVAQDNEAEVDVEGLPMSDIIKLTRGKKGTGVTITFRKENGSINPVRMVRDELQLEESFIKTAVIGDAHKTGYIYFPKFYTSYGDEKGRRCSEDMAKAIVELQKEKVDGIIIDIRNNGGGSLAEVISMLGLFIKDGPVVQIKSPNSEAESARVNTPRPLYEGPLVVLVNELSASASEIFAAAIQDYKRGIIMGNSTFGKGTVQRSLNVPYSPREISSANGDLGSVHITLQKYYRITGEATQINGVNPDISLPGIYSPYKIKEKDKKSSLAWDIISPLAYNPYQPQSFATTVSSANVYFETDSLLSVMTENLGCLTDKENEYVLTIPAFKEQRDSLQKCSEKVMEIYRSAKDLKVHNTVLTEKSIEQKEDFRKENNKAFLNNLSKDLYLSKAVEVMEKFVFKRPA